MLVIFRWWYFLGVGGFILAGYGGIETSLAMKCGPEPLALTIEQLSTGPWPSQRWVKLGPHVALLDHQGALETGGRVKVAFHPIVGADHPYLQAWAALLQRHGRVEDVPIGQLPTLDGVRLLVQTKSRVPVDPRSTGTRERNAIEGLLRGGASLDSDERSLIRGMLPGEDPGGMRVIEAGRRPLPVAFAIAMLVMGLAALLFAIKLFRKPGASAVG